MKNLIKAGVAGLMLTCGLASAASAQVSDAYIGEMRIFPIPFCPNGWAEASGQLLPVASNTALFSLYGTTFGGDGRNTFALPDLRGRLAVGSGSGPGLTPYPQGAKWGVETVTLNQLQIPSHSHRIQATSTPPDTGSVNGHGWGEFPANAPSDTYNTGGPLSEPARSDMIAMTGGNQSHDNMAPSSVLRHCVALYGVYPPRG